MYDREIRDKILTFRFHPEVFNENLLFEDLETGSVWSQLAQEAIKGPLKGTGLKSVPALQTTWRHWKSLHPDTLGTIDSFDRHQKMLYVSTGTDTQPHSFELGERTKLKWKKDLAWADLASGLQVEVKFVEGVRKALEIKVLSGSGKRD